MPQGIKGQLAAELNRIAITTSFNGQKLLDGTMGAQNFQVGANAGEIITANGTNFQTHVYGNNRVYSKPTDVANKAAMTDKINITGYLGAGDEINTAGADLTAKQFTTLVNMQADKTGVTATARTEAFLTATATKSYSFDILSNNETAVSITFTVGVGDDADAYAQAINAFNAVSSKTGVTAEFVGGMTDNAGAALSVANGIKLTNSSGETITLADQGAAKDATLANIAYATSATVPGTIAANQAYSKAGTAIDAAGVSSVGTVTFDSQAGFNVADGSADFDSNAMSSNLNAVQGLDVTTFAKAQLAIAIVDAAINVVNKEMARYGALQARFDATIKNLEVNAENTTNARSRIEDADFAQETANLSRATILQQAGTAMLAQANQIPQNVLSLIR